MPWLSIIFRISHSCLAAKFGLIGPALVHIMGATITCNLKPLMIKSSFIHDCAPQSLGPITFFFFFFFLYLKFILSAWYQRAAPGLSNHAGSGSRSALWISSLACHFCGFTHVNCVNLGAFLRVKKLEVIFSSALENSALSRWKKKMLFEVWALAVILIKRRLRLLPGRFGRNCRWGHTSSAKSATFPGVPCMASNNQYRRAHSFSVSDIIIDSLFGSCWARFWLLKITHYLLERKLSEKLCFKYYSITW